MRLGRLTSTGLCLIAAFAMTAATAQAATPLWYVKETGSWVPFGGKAGLVELMAPETLQSMGGLEVVSKSTSNCLVRDRESIEDPQIAPGPGTGEMEEFEVLCERGTGSQNAAAPFPCVTGEPFELKGVSPNWPSVLEVGGARAFYGLGPKSYEKFTGVDVEVYCLASKEHGEYIGSLRPEVEIGRLLFHGSESGELEEASSGHRLYFKGSDYFAPERYKDVRADSEYKEPTITSLTPNHGPTAGGNTITVDGGDFGLGTETTFDFGKTAGSSVDCTSTTECTVTAPAHAAGKVKVIAVVGNTKSQASAPGDQYTYQ